MDVYTLLEQATYYGLEYFKIYPGLYRAQVDDNQDPEERGRIRCCCPAVRQRKPYKVWIKPAFSGAGVNRGTFWPPEVGDVVYLSFRLGNPSKPEFYVGGWYGYPGDKTDLPAEFTYTNGKPQKRGFLTRGGHSLVFSDEPENEYIRFTWHKTDAGGLDDEAVTPDRAAGEFAIMEIGKDGGITLSNKNGSSIFLSAEGENINILSEQGHSVSLTADGINIVHQDGNLVALDKNDLTLIGASNTNITGGACNIKTGGVFLGDPAAFKAVLGELLVQYLSTHTHGTGVGPSSPPIVPPPPTILSNAVKLKQ